MKGFLIGFAIFLIWASAGIYYLHLKPETIATNSVVTNAEKALVIKDTIPTLANGIKEERVDSITAPVIPAIQDENVSSLIDTRTVDNVQEHVDAVTGQIPETDPTFLIDEIKKSIVLTDSANTLSTTAISSKVFYPKYERTELILDKELVNYVNELKTFLAENPNKKVTIIGHTDNIGNAQDNYQSGLRKSRQVKWYLTARRSIPRAKVTAVSQGENEPIASNNNASGRKQNNRIEIIID